jgi:dTDP-4-dehydrorhamnose reductase
MTLIIGGNGQLGRALGRLLSDAPATEREELDLVPTDAVYPTLERRAPDEIVNCAAFNAVDAAEEHEATAHAVNAAAVGEMTRYAADHGIRFVTFSTNYVFAGDGTRPYLESDPTDPINAYGRTKRAGEVLALGYAGSLVIRTSWLVSATAPNFVATMIRLARDRELRVVDDQVGCPTIAADLAAGTLRAMQAGATGLLHLANQGVTSWYHLARHAIELAGLDPARITPCTTEEYPTPAARPAYSVLGSERLGQLGIEPLPPWEESLPATVAALVASGV